MTVVEKLLEFFNNPEDWYYAFCHEDYGIMSVVRTHGTGAIDLMLKSRRTITVYKVKPVYSLSYFTLSGTKWLDGLAINVLFDEIKTL